MIKVQPEASQAQASQEQHDLNNIRRQKQLYMQQMNLRMGELTKDLDAFYTIFIQ